MRLSGQGARLYVCMHVLIHLSMYLRLLVVLYCKGAKAKGDPLPLSQGLVGRPCPINLGALKSSAEMVVDVCVYIIYIHNMCRCVYVSVYVSAYVYTCVHVYMYICIFAFAYMCMYIYMCIYIYVYMYMYIYLYMYYMKVLYMCMYLFMHVYTYMYLHMQAIGWGLRQTNPDAETERETRPRIRMQQAPENPD